MADQAAVEGRPCRYCVAAWKVETAEESCPSDHRAEPRVYALAIALAKVFQQRNPTDEQIGYFMGEPVTTPPVVGALFDQPPAVVTWDWRSQLPLDRLDQVLADATGGQLRVHSVETGGDQYAIVISSPDGGQAAAQAAYEAWLEIES